MTYKKKAAKKKAVKKVAKKECFGTERKSEIAVTCNSFGNLSSYGYDSQSGVNVSDSQLNYAPLALTLLFVAAMVFGG